MARKKTLKNRKTLKKRKSYGGVGNNDDLKLKPKLKQDHLENVKEMNKSVPSNLAHIPNVKNNVKQKLIKSNTEALIKAITQFTKLKSWGSQPEALKKKLLNDTRRRIITSSSSNNSDLPSVNEILASISNTQMK